MSPDDLTPAEELIYDDLLTLEEAAASLGVSTLAIAQWRLPIIRIGAKTRLIFKPDLVRGLAARRRVGGS